jgi:hypothetical protein
VVLFELVVASAFTADAFSPFFIEEEDTGVPSIGELA